MYLRLSVFFYQRSSAILKMPLYFSLCFFFFYSFPLFILSFAFTESYLYLCFSLLEIYVQRNKSKTSLAEFPPQFTYFFSVKKQFSCSEGVMVLNVAVAVRADVAVKKKNLIVLYNGITVFEIDPAFS